MLRLLCVTLQKVSRHAIASPVIGVFDVQRLMPVADEVNDELQRLTTFRRILRAVAENRKLVP